MGYERLQVSAEDRIVTIEIDRPKALNALNEEVMRETLAHAEALDADAMLARFDAMLSTNDSPPA